MGRVLAIIGIALTVVYALFAWWLVGDRIQTLQTMDLNEVGDFLAGAFGPVTILWLVLGFFQQGIELRQGTTALNLQAAELRNSVAQQCEMVAAQKASLLNYEKTLHPLLGLEVTSAGWKEDDFGIEIKISNSGDYCESVVVKLNAEDMKSRRRNIDPLMTGSNCVLSFMRLSEWADLNVIIEYRMRNGTTSSQSFLVTHHYDEGYGNSYSVTKLSFMS
jgi:hypothetical protein